MKLLSLLTVCALGLTCLLPAGVRAQGLSLGVKPKIVELDPTAKNPATALVGVRVKAPGNAPVELVALKTNIGTLSKAQKKGRSTWVATYTPPLLRFPTVALLRADVKVAGRLLRRFRALPVAIKTGLTVPTKGAFEISIAVENKDYPSVTPKRRQAEVTVPVVIPPGVRNYTITRITDKGVTSAETKRFSLPPFPRLVVAAPSSAPAGSTFPLDVFLVTPKGKRYTYKVPVLVSCPGGQVVKIQGLQSRQRHWIKLGGETGPVRIRIALRNEPKVAAVHALNVELARTRRLALSVTPKRLAMSASRSVKVLVRVTDLYSNAARAEGLSVTANGKPLSVGRLSVGLWRGWIYAPSDRQPGDRIVVRATARRARPAVAVVDLLGDVATKLRLRMGKRSLMADGKQGVEFSVWATDRLGMPARDKTVRVESDHGKLSYLHRVRPGFFRGLFVPHKNATGGVAVVRVSTYRAHGVSGRVRLTPIPQHLLLTAMAGSFSDIGRTVGLSAGLRFEYAVYRKRPAVHLGLQALLGPHFGVGNVTEADPYAGFTGGLTALVRLRIVGYRRFTFDGVADVGVLGIYSAYRRFNPPSVDRRQRGRAAFTTSLALELGLRTLGRNEAFLQLRFRYLTASPVDAATDNHVLLFAGLGYRFEL